MYVSSRDLLLGLLTTGMPKSRHISDTRVGCWTLTDRLRVLYDGITMATDYVGFGDAGEGFVVVSRTGCYREDRPGSWEPNRLSVILVQGLGVVLCGALFVSTMCTVELAGYISTIFSGGSWGVGGLIVSLKIPTDLPFRGP